MSSYLVLARKYRPQNFNELVGQEVLVKTLTNAIKNNRLHHAYILHGIRGVGKTTTARIIAKTLNCLNDEMRLNGEACGTCKNCVAISNSHHQDVFEIDAASRTGVGDVREIIDSVAYAPVEARYKIYIIDEFHMMSDSAFNALLKTLEEPPVNVKFIFATTEIREVPQTILSRCQRFNLRRLDESEIIDHLKNILTKEGFEAEEQALNLIAKSSEGSVRDALSILDQALANNNHQNFLASMVIEQMLGLSDRFAIIELLENLVKGDVKMAHKNFADIFQNSSDVEQVSKDLLELIHKILSIKLINEYQIDAFSKSQFDKLKNIAENTDISDLIRIWQLISKSMPDISNSSSSKMYFEMLIIRICHLIALPDLKQVLININQEKLSISSAINSQNIETNSQEFHKTSDLKIEDNSELIAQILKNFEGSRIV
ncbi:MAG: DNA polymerase III subunit gamma/tau [Proteobacteria bacterium]|nr:DNA polymerase III subunit gamma/tau [Pseudomonadota bacterium]